MYAEAVQLYLARFDTDAITEALDAVCAATDTRLEPGLAAASVATLKRSAW